MKEDIEKKLEELNRTLYRALVSGEAKFNENMNVELAKKNLDCAVKLEEYEAAEIFRKFIDL